MSGTREGLLIGSIFKCLVLQDLGKKLRLSPGDSVLDVGSGLGGFAFYLAKVLNTSTEGNSMYRYVYNVCVCVCVCVRGGYGGLDFGRTVHVYRRVQICVVSLHKTSLSQLYCLLEKKKKSNQKEKACLCVCVFVFVCVCVRARVCVYVCNIL